tara:strand:- start:3726 stop:4664 length:939 start_codon:yes stop_codon:yes gene_type:complete
MNKRYSNIVFFNYFHNGDIHISRNYIKLVMDKMKYMLDGEFYETHRNDPCLLADIEGINHLPFQMFSNSQVPYNVPHYLDNNRNLYINTWAGQDHCRKDPSEKRCTFPSITDNYNMILEDLGVGKLDSNVVDIFPSIDYNKINTHNIDTHFVGTDRRHVLICNGDTLSGQCPNFDFNPIIDRLAENHRSIDFVLTNHSDNRVERENVFYSEDIIGDVGHSDLNEISYLSTFCGLMVGRISGPHTFSFVRENYINENKTNIAICEDYKESDYDAKIYPECKMKTLWSKYESDSQVEGLIETAMNELFSEKAGV